MKFIFSVCISLIYFSSFSQTTTYKCYPTNWWVNMKNPKLQIMLHGKNVASCTISVNYPGFKLDKINKVENPNYVFLDVSISPTAKPGIVQINLLKGDSSYAISFPLKARRTGKGNDYARGVTSLDFIYLIMPDRFSNGDSNNDRVLGMKDQTLRRDTVFNRHGGDLQGIINHFDYLQSLGVTTVWLNPVIENDMPNRTEHGYAFTDHYTVDRRIGGDTAYKRLVDVAHAKNIKVIQDAVYNHVGIEHFTITDMPMKDWVHQWPAYTNTNYREQTHFDPYIDSTDKKKMTDGWFTQQMPDLNQQNPYVANFLIQHAIWTVEEFGIDGWRIDTYSYNDLDFMNRCNKALTDEYPKLTMFGETWVHGVANQSYFVQNNLNLPFKSNLQAATDFQTLWGITDALTKDNGWMDGINALYNTLAQDFLYKDPARNVIFLDNHDISRFFSVVNEDETKYKTALAWLLTCRGIPQLYYGDELGLTGVTSPNDGYVRQDFPGGWPSDSVNKFSIAGRTAKEEGIWRYIAKLANYRKVSSALTTGKMMQYIPEDGVYVYFRYDDFQTVMTIMNTSKERKSISLGRYNERTNGFTKMKNIQTGETKDLGNISLNSYESTVVELVR